MNAILFIVIFQSMNSILTKGVLRAGGDTKFLMAGDILFLWVASVPLGALAGLVLDLPAFWVYTFLKIDQIIKCVWCYFRLKSGKWLTKIKPAKQTWISIHFGRPMVVHTEFFEMYNHIKIHIKEILP